VIAAVGVRAFDRGGAFEITMVASPVELLPPDRNGNQIRENKKSNK